MKISGFFCVGAVMHQTGKNYVYELDGLGRRMPLTFTALLISGLSLSGLPLFAGFVSKWEIARSLFTNGSALASWGVIVLIYSALMTAIYMLTVIVRGFFPARDVDMGELKAYGDPSWQMILPLAVFSVVTVMFGVWATPILEKLWTVAQGLF